MASLNPEDLVFHFLNVGQGDAIIVGFPAETNEKRSYGVVDCGEREPPHTSGKKLLDYLDLLMQNMNDRRRLLFVCATHPHMDHISGLKMVLEHPEYHPLSFWDSGFRYPSETYMNILDAIAKSGDIDMIRVSAGMERYFGQVRITALAPSIRLRNRYATYGVDSNNASIVLRFEYHTGAVLLSESMKYNKKEMTQDEAMEKVGKSVVILAGDAEFDSWGYIADEFPTQSAEDEQASLRSTPRTKLLNPLSAWVVKVPHHGSMHSASLDIYEKMGEPSLAIISNMQQMSNLTINGQVEPRGQFPHRSTINSLHETGTLILTTDGSYESELVNGRMRNPKANFAGNIVVAVPPPPKNPKYIKVQDGIDTAKLPPFNKGFTAL